MRPRFVTGTVGLGSKRAAGSASGGPPNSAEDLLRERFARGEIDAEEYEKDLDVLNGDRTRASVTD